MLLFPFKKPSKGALPRNLAEGFIGFIITGKIMSVPIRKRQTAKRCRVSLLNQGTITEFNEKHFLNTDWGRAGRVRLLGTITRIITGAGTYRGATLDDGTGAIFIKSWEGAIDKLEEWDSVEVVGRVQVTTREETSEFDVFVNPEIAKKVHDHNWELVHRLEVIRNPHRLEEPLGEKILEEPTETDKEADEKALAVSEAIEPIITELDTGTGVKFEEIQEKVPGITEAELESALTILLEKGDIYEPHPGQFRVTV